MRHETSDKGDIGVAKVTADLIEKGVSVMVPISSTSPFDLVSYDGKEFKRIQVKYRNTKKNGTLSVAIERSIISNSKHTSVRNEYVDIVAIYSPDTGKCYYVEMEEGMTCVSLRVNKAKNNQSKGVRIADDYLEYPNVPLA